MQDNGHGHVLASSYAGSWIALPGVEGWMGQVRDSLARSIALERYLISSCSAPLRYTVIVTYPCACSNSNGTPRYPC